jgi:hypothetical protein
METAILRSVAQCLNQVRYHVHHEAPRAFRFILMLSLLMHTTVNAVTCIWRLLSLRAHGRSVPIPRSSGTLGRDLECTCLVMVLTRQYGRCAIAACALVGDEVPGTHQSPNSSRGQVTDYTESLLPLLRGVLETRVGEG